MRWRGSVGGGGSGSRSGGRLQLGISSRAAGKGNKSEIAILSSPSSSPPSASSSNSTTQATLAGPGSLSSCCSSSSSPSSPTLTPGSGETPTTPTSATSATTALLLLLRRKESRGKKPRSPATPPSAPVLLQHPLLQHPLHHQHQHQQQDQEDQQRVQCLCCSPVPDGSAPTSSCKTAASSSSMKQNQRKNGRKMTVQLSNGFKLQKLGSAGSASMPNVTSAWIKTTTTGAGSKSFSTGSAVMINGNGEEVHISRSAQSHAFKKLKTPARCKECDSYLYFYGLECHEVSLLSSVLLSLSLFCFFLLPARHCLPFVVMLS